MRTVERRMPADLTADERSALSDTLRSVTRSLRDGDA